MIFDESLSSICFIEFSIDWFVATYFRASLIGSSSFSVSSRVTMLSASFFAFDLVILPSYIKALVITEFLLDSFDH